jgi:glutathione S-transferase
LWAAAKHSYVPGWLLVVPGLACAWLQCRHSFASARRSPLECAFLAVAARFGPAATMKLYASAASSFARKIRVMLLEKGVEHELELVNLWEPNQLHRVNPLGKVPALELDDGRVLISSSMIADFIDGNFPDPRFIPEDFEGRMEVRRWEALADGTMDAVSATLYEMRFHDQAGRSEAWMDRQRTKFEGGFNALEAMLGDRRWCVGDRMSLADISVACHLGFVSLRVPHHFPRDRYPGLDRLWKRMEERDSFMRTAPPSAQVK